MLVPGCGFTAAGLSESSALLKALAAAAARSLQLIGYLEEQERIAFFYIGLKKRLNRKQHSVRTVERRRAKPRFFFLPKVRLLGYAY